MSSSNFRDALLETRSGYNFEKENEELNIHGYRDRENNEISSTDNFDYRTIHRLENEKYRVQGDRNGTRVPHGLARK